MPEQEKGDELNEAPEGAAANQEQPAARKDDHVPEPPASWRPPVDRGGFESGSANTESGSSGAGMTPPSQQPATMQNQGSFNEFERIRKYITASQICAVVSLFVGGVVLSTASVVVAIMGYRILAAASANETLDPGYIRPLRQSAFIAMFMGGVALVLNVVSVVYLYPMVMQALNSGDLSSLIGGGQIGSSPGTGSSTWG